MTGTLSTRDSITQWRRRREDLRLCNNDDVEREITISIRDERGRRHEETYKLLPDQSGSALTLLPEGTYRVTAVTDDDRRDRAAVRVADRSEDTVVVAVDGGEVTVIAPGR